MRVEYINPFIESVYELFTTMLSSKAVRGDVGVARGEGGGNPHDLMAIIGLSGPARGTVALAIPEQTAINIVERLLGMRPKQLDETVSDAIAEVVNIVAGGAKAKFGITSGPPIQLSLPTVVHGTSYNVDYPSKSIWLEVPFNSDLGGFTMRVTFEVGAGKG